MRYHGTAELVNIAQTMVAINKPASRDFKSVQNFFYNEQPFCKEDEYYIYHKEDIVTLKPGRENAWLDGIVETILQKFTCTPIRVGLSQDTLSKLSDMLIIITVSLPLNSKHTP
jgi:hypothetical protein